VEERSGEDGNQKIEIPMGNVFPAGFYTRLLMFGRLLAPAVRIVSPWWERDLWVFLLRSPWFPMRLQLDKPELSLERDGSMALASFGVSEDGSLTGKLTLDGSAYKKASLYVRRTIGQSLQLYDTTQFLDEPIQEVQGGAEEFEWKPTVRKFNLVLVTQGRISESQVWEIADGLGADTSQGILGRRLKGDFVLCDGPATSYTVTLRGHRGLLENDEDKTGAKFTGATPSPVLSNAVLVKCQYCGNEQRWSAKCDRCGAPLPGPASGEAPP
jgi:hypothetical protein